VIGIDEFKSEKIPNLHGAVADANEFEDYLKTHLAVEDSHIVNLRNERATRDAILQELDALRTRPSIGKGDPIVIFFATHGTTFETPPNWNSGHPFISSIVPHDCYEKDSSGNETIPIPDLTIAASLDKLADPEGGKGDNITVILDCCHSGSGTRSLEEFTDPTERIRGIDFLPEFGHPIPSNVDKHILAPTYAPRGLYSTKESAHIGTRSHVLLAACSPSEKAREKGGRGLFTLALLKALTGVANMDEMTYHDLHHRIPRIYGQTPQCEGENTGRKLFNSRIQSKRLLLHRVRKVQDRYIMDAGAIHGISENSKFAIYESRHITPEVISLATMTAHTVGLFQTDMSLTSNTEAPFNIEGFYFALKTSATEEEEVTLHIPLHSELLPFFQKLKEEFKSSGKRPIRLVTDDSDSADISASALGNGRIEYRIKNQKIAKYAPNKLYKSITGLDQLKTQQIIQSASHFFWHLRRCPKESHLKNKIYVEFHKLRQDKSDGNGWKRHGGNLIKNNVIDIEADTGYVNDNGTLYGMTVWNNTKTPLHVSAFYFDCYDLSIEKYYLPPATGVNAAPSLPGDGKLTIGYGDGGGIPMGFYVRDGQTLDIGFLKIFVSTESVDLEGTQWSDVPAFQSTERAMRPYGAIEPQPQPLPDSWDTVEIAVVQRRPRQFSNLMSWLWHSYFGAATGIPTKV